MPVQTEQQQDNLEKKTPFPQEKILFVVNSSSAGQAAHPDVQICLAAAWCVTPVQETHPVKHSLCSNFLQLSVEPCYCLTGQRWIGWGALAGSTMLGGWAHFHQPLWQTKLTWMVLYTPSWLFHILSEAPFNQSSMAVVSAMCVTHKHCAHYTEALSLTLNTLLVVPETRAMSLGKREKLQQTCLEHVSHFQPQTSSPDEAQGHRPNQGIWLWPHRNNTESNFTTQV